MEIDLLNVTITDMEHWYNVRQSLLHFGNKYPQYHRDFHRLLANIDSIMLESSKILMRIRRRPSDAGQTLYNEKIQQANDVLSFAQQHLLLMILANQDFA